MKIKFLLFSFCIVPFFSISQNEIKATLQFQKDTLGLIDLWPLEIIVTNIGNEPQKVFPLYVMHQGFFVFGEIILQTKKAGDTIWVDAKTLPSLHEEKIEEGRSLINLAPNQIFRSGIIPFTPPTALGPGSYQMRVSYLVPMDNNFNIGYKVFSNPVDIYIKAYTDEDLAFFTNFSQDSLPLFFYRPIYFMDYDTTYVKISEALLQKYPNSAFAPYIKLYLSIQFFGKAQISLNINKNKKSSIEYMQTAKRYLSSALKSGYYYIVPVAKPLLVHYNTFVLGDIFLYDDPPEEILREFDFENKF